MNQHQLYGIHISLGDTEHLPDFQLVDGVIGQYFEPTTSSSACPDDQLVFNPAFRKLDYEDMLLEDVNVVLPVAEVAHHDLQAEV